MDLLEQLFPLLENVVEQHCIGTRFGIRMDPQDGLLQAGMDGIALTWMDAKAGDHVFTSRIGKPVELGALWFNALSIMKTFASDLGLESKSDYYSSMAFKTEKGFRHKFWNSSRKYCFDVVDDQAGVQDASLRPNQLIAASLQWSPLSSEQRLQVVEACAHELVTSHGLRTLSVDDENYQGVYDGDIFSRDGAYHQGTVWPWLLGPFVIAHLRAYSDRLAARAYLLPLLSTIGSAGQGTISEIFDGDAPFRPRGCIAQAWSVAEFLRAWIETEPDTYQVEQQL
jgi:predicted glycogen debranching enzyme